MVTALLESFNCFSQTVWNGQKILRRSITVYWHGNLHQAFQLVVPVPAFRSHPGLVFCEFYLPMQGYRKNCIVNKIRWSELRNSKQWILNQQEITIKNYKRKNFNQKFFLRFVVIFGFVNTVSPCYTVE